MPLHNIFVPMWSMLHMTMMSLVAVVVPHTGIH